MNPPVIPTALVFTFCEYF